MATASETTDVSELRKLIEKKEGIEAEIKELYEVLESQKGVGMEGPLVDEESFPRSDIDVYTVRHARHMIICLQNDHKALMKEIEQGLYKVHAQARNEEQSQPVAMETEQQKADLKPFATVDRVEAQSPAAQGGLQVGDQLIQFGSISDHNFKSLQDIGLVVQHSKGRAVNVTVIRDLEEVHLAVTPQTWSGRGLLGCNIVPVPR